MENERESLSLTIHKTSHNRDYTIYNIHVFKILYTPSNDAPFQNVSSSYIF